MRPILFIDRDGVILQEPKSDFQIDHIDKTSFVPGAISNLHKIATELGFYKVMVTNQDGLGTSSFPEETFWPTQKFTLKAFENEGIKFDEFFIDRSFPEDNVPTRKPKTGMLSKYLYNSEYDLKNSFVIGDRITDVELAKNLGSLNTIYELELQESNNHLKALNQFYGKLAQASEAMNGTAEDALKAKEQIGALANNLGKLNQVYGNMLTAMQGR